MPTSSRPGHERGRDPVGAPALAVLVCRDGAGWLPEALHALRTRRPRPRRMVAVDVGSAGATPDLLTAALHERLLDGVLRMPPATPFGTAVAAAVRRVRQRWDDLAGGSVLVVPPQPVAGRGVPALLVDPGRSALVELPWLVLLGVLAALGRLVTLRPAQAAAQLSAVRLLILEYRGLLAARRWLGGGAALGWLPAGVLLLGLTLISLLVHRDRLGLDLSGGRLAPPLGLGETWAQYLAEWHPVLGGTSAPAPASMAVLGVLGAVVAPLGGPAAAASLLVLGAMPLAGGCAYFAGRRLQVPRWARALAAVVYALLPVGTAAAAQGRLDVVMAHVLLPAVLAGVVGLLAGWSLGSGPRGWLPSACATALGLAVVSAFAPVVHLLVLLLVLVGFVAIPSQPGEAARRVVALFAVVMLPLGLLLPWPAIVVQHPSVLLHGVGAVTSSPQPGVGRLLLLDAGDSGWPPWVGALLVAGALAGALVRRRRPALAGLAVAVVGLGAAVVVSSITAAPLVAGAPRPGFPGTALVLAGAGLIWAALGAYSAGDGDRPVVAVGPMVVAAVGAVLVAASVWSALVDGGALRTDPPRLAGELQAGVEADGTGVLVVGAAGEPVRLAVGRLPAFGDDDLAPVGTAPFRMARWAAAFGSGQAGMARAAVLDAAASGIALVVLPDGAAAERLLAGAGELVAGAAPTSDGRPVVKLLPPAWPVVVLAPQLADRARTGGAPPADYGTSGVVQVPAVPPAVAVEISAGARSRALVVAVEMEDGWQASVGGRPAQLTRAWGHLVAVPLPAEASQVRVERSSAVRVLLLLLQLAVALFTLVTAIPPQGRG